MTDETNSVEQKYNNQVVVKKVLKNIGWYNFTAYFLYGIAVGQSVYTPRWDIGLMIAMVGFAFNLLAWKSINLVEKLSK